MIRIGLLGASKIAKGAIIEPVKLIDAFDVSCLAARDIDRATNFAKLHTIPSVAQDYSELVQHDDVDLVYNALPPSEHAHWSIEALRAGKSVLCEKPFALNAAQAREMVEVATECGQHLIEAFHYRFHPLFDRVLELVHGGLIGELIHVQAWFNVPIHHSRDELRYIPELGGGAMMDLGCYPMHWARTIIGEEPVVASSQGNWHESGVDSAMHLELEFPSGPTAEVECSMSENLEPGLDAALVVSGSSGNLRVSNPLAPHEGHKIVMEAAAGEWTETVAGKSTYFHQLQHVADVLSGRTEALTGGDDAIANMQVITDAYQMARQSH